MSETPTPEPTGAPRDPSQTAVVPYAPARDARGRLLPGHGGVPGSGRPKGLAERVRKEVDFGMAISTLVEIAWGKLAPSARIADRIKAIELLMDRGYGKPQVTVDVKGEGGASMVGALRALPFDQLLARVETMRQLAEGTQSDDVIEGVIVEPSTGGAA